MILYAAWMPGQALSELNTPSSARNGGTSRVNISPQLWFRLPIEETNAMTRNDWAAR
ncbi:hypothetical protein D3C71_2182950 [compost metagenome]